MTVCMVAVTMIMHWIEEVALSDVWQLSFMLSISLVMHHVEWQAKPSA